MFKSDNEILFTVISSVLFMLGLATVFILAIVRYQRRVRLHAQEKTTLKAQYEQEILQSQIEVQNQTLAYIGRELHDNIGQLLSVTKINLNVVEDTLDQHQFECVSDNFQQANQLIDVIITEVRGLSKSLDGNFVQEFGLSESLESELQRIEKTRRFATHFITEGEVYSLGFQKEIILFRIAQEVLNNAIKHAQATTLSVKLLYQTTSFQLQISDNGKGFDVQLAQNQILNNSGSGLRSIQKRANLIGGICTFESVIGVGTKVDIKVEKLI